MTVQDPRAIVEIELDKPRRLRFDFNALVEAEKSLGVSFNQMNPFEMGLTGLRSMLRAGLLWEDKTLTDEGVGSLMDLKKLSVIRSAVAKAFTAAFGVEAKEESPNAPGPESGAGKTPSAAPAASE